MEGGWWRTAEVMLGEGEALPASQSEALRLGATALLALGFYTRQPRLIADADVVLNDAMACAGAHVEIERTICAVLLGQPAAALPLRARSGRPQPRGGTHCTFAGRRRYKMYRRRWVLWQAVGGG